MTILITYSLFVCVVLLIYFKIISCVEHSPRGCYLKNIIPYKFYGTFSDQEKLAIFKEFEILQNRTCLRFVEQDKVASNSTGLVGFRDAPGAMCSANGRYLATGPFVTDLYLNSDCILNRTVVMHELMHALGFFHEHQRRDRNCYVKVEDRYSTHVQYQILPTYPWLERFPYDRFSVVHFKRSDRIKSLEEPGGSFWPIGQSTPQLTDLDVWKIQYKFCGSPHYCDIYEDKCKAIENMENSRGCKQS